MSDDANVEGVDLDFNFGESNAATTAKKEENGCDLLKDLNGHDDDINDVHTDMAAVMQENKNNDFVTNSNDNELNQNDINDVANGNNISAHETELDCEDSQDTQKLDDCADHLKEQPAELSDSMNSTNTADESVKSHNTSTNSVLCTTTDSTHSSDDKNAPEIAPQCIETGEMQLTLQGSVDITAESTTDQEGNMHTADSIPTEEETNAVASSAIINDVPDEPTLIDAEKEVSIETSAPNQAVENTQVSDIETMGDDRTTPEPGIPESVTSEEIDVVLAAMDSAIADGAEESNLHKLETILTNQEEESLSNNQGTESDISKQEAEGQLNKQETGSESTNQEAESESTNQEAQGESSSKEAEGESSNQEADSESATQEADSESAIQEADSESTNQDANSKATNQEADSKSANHKAARDNMELDVDCNEDVPAICLISPKAEDQLFDYVEPQGDSSEAVIEQNGVDENEADDVPITGITDGQQKDDDDFDFDLPVAKTESGTTAQQQQTELETTSQAETAEAKEQESVIGEMVEEATVEEPLARVQDVENEIENNASKEVTTENKDVVSIEKVDNGVEAAPESVQVAREEWDQVHTITPAFADGDAASSAAKEPKQAQPGITYDEAVEKFRASDLTKHKDQIQTTVVRRGLSVLTHMLFGPPKLIRDLHADRDLIFCMAACPFDNDSFHFHVLQTIYQRLTGAKFECQRFGSHWEQIGFQGNDPATDLRGVGILGLIHLLSLITDPSTKQLATDIYKLSLHETQNFPFCVMGLSMSRIVIHILREETLNKDCNRRKHILSMSNELYASVYLQLYTVWKNEQKTIADSGYVLQGVETLAKKNPRLLLKNLETHLANSKKTTQVETEGEINFSKME